MAAGLWWHLPVIRMTTLMAVFWSPWKFSALPSFRSTLTFKDLPGGLRESALRSHLTPQLFRRMHVRRTSGGSLYWPPKIEEKSRRSGVGSLSSSAWSRCILDDVMWNLMELSLRQMQLIFPLTFLIRLLDYFRRCSKLLGGKRRVNEGKYISRSTAIFRQKVDQ